MSRRKLDPRTVERIMLAASKVDCASHREAAILGGIVNSLVGTGHLNLGYATHAASAAMEMARSLMNKWQGTLGPWPLLLPDASPPTEAELRDMCARWRDQYDPPMPQEAAA